MKQTRTLPWYLALVISCALVPFVAQGQSAPTSSSNWVVLPEVDPFDIEDDMQVAGSMTLEPLIEAIYKRFVKEGYRGVMKLDSTSTAEGFRLFCENGATDIAMASRRIRPEESEVCIANGRTPIPFHIATDTLAVVVNRANDFVTDVSLTDLAAIFTATRWSDVNPAWPQEKIHRFVPDVSSEGFNFFVDAVLAGQAAALSHAPNTTVGADNKLMIQGISLNPYAIGVFGYAYYQQHANDLKLLTIDGVRPTLQSVTETKYPLTRPLLLYADPATIKAKPQVKALVNFTLTHVNDELGTLGYFPTSPHLLNASRTAFLQVFGYPSARQQESSSQQIASGPEAKMKVMIAEQAYDASRAIAHVLKEILESRFGLDVGIVPSTMDTIFRAMDKGDGAIDVLPELTIPNHADKWATYIAPDSRASVLVNTQPYTSVQGLFVPGYIQDDHDVRDVQDLLNPETAKLFDSDGDGKGEFWPGAQGWGATSVELVKAHSYGYAKYFEPQLMDDVVFKAKLKAHYAEKKGILFYSWTPEWIHTAYDLRRLAEPPFTGFAMASQKSNELYNPNGCWHMVFPSQDKEWLRKSRITCAWPTSHMYVAFAKALSVRLPKVGQFLQQVAFDPAEIAEWIRQIGEQQRNPADVAKEWVRKYPDQVEQWLADISM
jgi:glycine betaine/proline transport system substrate-binding protein